MFLSNENRPLPKILSYSQNAHSAEISYLIWIFQKTLINDLDSSANVENPLKREIKISHAVLLILAYHYARIDLCSLIRWHVNRNEAVRHFFHEKGDKMSPIIFLSRYKLIGAIFKCFSFPPPRNVRNTCDTSASQEKWADRKTLWCKSSSEHGWNKAANKSKTKDDKGSGGITTNDSMRRNEKMSHSPGWSKCAKEDAKDPHHHKEGGRWHCFLPLFYYIYTLAIVSCVSDVQFSLIQIPPSKILCSARPCPSGPMAAFTCDSSTGPPLLISSVNTSSNMYRVKGTQNQSNCKHQTKQNQWKRALILTESQRFQN